MADVAYRFFQVHATKAKEATYNTSPSTAASYARVVTTKELKPILPTMRKIKRENLFGSDTQYLEKVCNDYWNHPGIPFADDLADFDSFAGKFLFRALGGTPSNTPLSAPAQQWDCLPLAATIGAGDQLPGTSIITLLGAASFLFSGCVVEEFEMTQEGMRPVEWRANLIGTGKHAMPHGVASLVTTEPTQKCPNPASSKFIWTNPTPSTVDWSSTGRVRGWGIGFKNNHILNDERQGDSTCTPTGGGAAYHVGRIRRGKMEITKAYVKIAMNDADVNEFLEASKNGVYTDVTWQATGALITGAIYEAQKIIAPKCTIDSEGITMENENDLTVMTIPLLVHKDATIGGLLKAQVINQTTSGTGYN